MSNEPNLETNPGQPTIYQIRVKGHLGQQWTDWFDGLDISLADECDTVITGPVVDQSALYGLLKKIRDLGLPLISLARLDPGPEESQQASEEHSNQANHYEAP